MRGRTEWRTAMALVAASSGLGLASGRAQALFFGQTGRVAWVGVLAASVLYGALVGGAAALGHGAGGSAWLERACEALRLLLAALISAFMLYRLGRVGELTLPMRHGYAFGAGFGLLGALALGRLSSRGQARLAMFIALYATLFFIGNAVDTRPATLHNIEAVEFALRDDLRAALMLALPFAALNACAAVWRFWEMGPGGPERPVWLGAKSAMLFGAPMAVAVGTLVRAGEGVMAQPMPWVVLSARWGLAGFWLCAGLQAICAASTLSAALGLLVGRISRGGADRARAIGMVALGALLFCALSYSGTAS